MPPKAKKPAAAPTRASQRKRNQPAKLADDYDFDLEELLESHEQKGVEYRAKRDAKKQRTAKDVEDEKYADAFKGYEIPFDSLPALCLERIFAMIDSPQDLYNLAFSSKFLMSLVTPEVVIRSAVFNNLRKKDKKSRKVMSNLMGFIGNRSIHIPSAHRMLRLLNAKSCERGEQCWGRNLNTGKAGQIPSGSCARPFGLALCDKCLKFGTTKVPYSHFSRFQNGVAFHNWNVLMDPQKDPKTGEVNGPILQVLELQQIENTYTTAADKKSALEGIVQRALDNTSNHCPAHYEEKAAAYKEMWDNAEKEADEVVARAQEEDEQKFQERREERIAKKMTRVRAIYANLEESLSDCPLKDLALDCTWLENDERCLSFSCHIVNQTMSGIISAPASSSERTINNAAETIKQIFNTMHEKNFFTFNYIENSSNRFRRGIHEYCSNETSQLEIMKSSTAGDTAFMQALDENKPVRALVRALNRMRGALPRVFALSVVRDTNQEERDDVDNRVDHFRKLAETVWSKKAPSQYGADTLSFNSIKESFNSSVEEFRIMKKNVKDYLADDQTRRFLLRDNAIAGRENFSREDAVNQVFAPKIHTTWTAGTRSSAYDQIRNRNFEQLRTLHEQYFRRPTSYSVHRLDIDNNNDN